MLPELERHHDVLAPTLVGHGGGPPLEGEVTRTLLADPLQLAARGLGRRATQFTTVNFEHIPAELLVHQTHAVAACDGVVPMSAFVKREGYELDAERIACPVRVVWGTQDKILAWPSSAVRYRDDWLPRADWVVLEGVGHCPQLDVPLETAQLIVDFIAGTP